MNEIQILTPEYGEEVLLPYFPEGIKAGFPSPATDYEEEAIDLNKELVHHKEATFYARVKGDSMINAGYHPGDIIVIDKSLDPSEGDMAVCFLDGEFTLKFVSFKERDRGRMVLRSGNGKYPPIEVTESNDFTVWGVVTYVIKKVCSRS